MKRTILIMASFFTVTTFASTFQNVSTLTNSSLNSSASKIARFEGIYRSTLKKVVVLKASGKTIQEQRAKTLAQAAHTLCRYFDEGVTLGLESADEKGSQNAADSLISNNIDDENGVILKSISAVNGKNGVEVYSGEAFGNNTAGLILGFYDTKNNEIAVFANTNCGSDD